MGYLDMFGPIVAIGYFAASIIAGMTIGAGVGSIVGKIIKPSGGYNNPGMLIGAAVGGAVGGVVVSGTFN